MRKIFLFITISVFFLTCSQSKEKQPLNNPFEESEEIVQEERITKYHHFDKIDSLEQIYYKKSMNLRDTLLAQFDINKIPRIKAYRNKKENIADDIRKSLINCDSAYYFELYLELFPSEKEFNSVPYSLYMAEKCNKAFAYDLIHHYYYRIDYLAKNNRIMRPTLSSDEEALALWALIKAYNGGYLDCIPTLASYFRNGRYFPKDIELAEELELIYKHRFD